MPSQLAKLYLLHVERRLNNMLGDESHVAQPGVSASSLHVMAKLIEGKTTNHYAVWSQPLAAIGPCGCYFCVLLPAREVKLE
jgi:hypothetical protein